MSAVLKPHVTYVGYEHARCEFRPLDRKLIQELIINDLYDPNYGENHNGLRGIYEAQLEDIEAGCPLDDERPITKLYTARIHNKLAGVAVAVRTKQIPGVDYVLHLWVKPEYRSGGIGQRLVYMVTTVSNIPGLGMHETETSKPLLKKNRSIAPLRRPSQLDRDVQRCLRSLDPKNKWVTEDGGLLLCQATIVDTLLTQQALIAELRKQINPHDNSILLI